VQGRLRKEDLSVTVETECAHCARPMRIQIDNKLRHHAHDEGAEPLVFTPNIDWATFTEPNIIHAY